MPVGLSGGVTTAGTAAALGGALFMATSAWALGWSLAGSAGILAGGIAGALADSLAGATAQDRRRCDGCGEWTERVIHSCGSKTRHASGLEWLDNDGVNVLCTVAGAATAASVAALLAWPVVR